jgi:hypothetical protein
MRVSGDPDSTNEDRSTSRTAGAIVILCILALGAIRVGMVRP